MQSSGLGTYTDGWDGKRQEGLGQGREIEAKVLFDFVSIINYLVRGRRN